MNKIIAEVSIIPLGAGTSISWLVAEAVKVLQESGLKYQLTSMGTIIEGPWGEVMDTIQEMHEKVFQSGALRVSTSLKIDDRRDGKEVSMERKVKAVEEKLS
ncbi:MAG: hypothetical protein DDT23_00972 [candidate division WS2 bacterium]|nr:hypothetical protein [Candidatus Lithacetigena glycinireducens]